MSNKIVIRAQPHDRGLLLEVGSGGSSALHIPLAWGEPFSLYLGDEGGDEVEISHLTMGSP
jgi:hypothetical protein